MMIAQEIIADFLGWLKSKLLSSLKIYNEGFIKYNVSNLETYEDTFLNFSLTQEGNFSARYANAENPRLSHIIWTSQD